MWWSKAKCPVRAEEQLWIEESLDWFVAEFGDAVLRRPVALPESAFFPADYTGTEDDVRAVFRTVCARLDVPPDRVLLEFEPDEAEDRLLRDGDLRGERGLRVPPVAPQLPDQPARLPDRSDVRLRAGPLRVAAR